MSTQPKSWRDVIKIHPAADLFPLLEPDQLTELAEDIRKNGLLQPVTVYRDDDETLVLVDGRNRLDAMQQLGWVKICKGEVTIEGCSPGAWQGPDDEQVKADPYGFAVALNVRRRHLSGEQKRELIEKLIKADPTKSNRQIAAMAERSHPTVAKIRDELEAKGDVEKFTTSIDTKGRKQPAQKTARPPISRDQRQPVVHTPASDMATLVRSFGVGNGEPVSAARIASKLRGGVAVSYVTGLLQTMSDQPIDGYHAEHLEGSGNEARWRIVPVLPSSVGERLRSEKIDGIVCMIHRLAGGSLDIPPGTVLASLDTKAKRTNALSSARLAHEWLGALLDATATTKGD